MSEKLSPIVVGTTTHRESSKALFDFKKQSGSASGSGSGSLVASGSIGMAELNIFWIISIQYFNLCSSEI